MHPGLSPPKSKASILVEIKSRQTRRKPPEAPRAYWTYVEVVRAATTKYDAILTDEKPALPIIKVWGDDSY